MTQEENNELENIDLETSLMMVLSESDHHLKIPTREEGFVLATRIDAIHPKLADLLGYSPNKEEIKEAAKKLCNKKCLYMYNICEITFLAVSSLGKREYSC